MKNIAASVRARLLNLARLERRDYNRLLVLWAQERLLARLAVSAQRDKFILKGGLLLYSRYGNRARPTQDMDWLGRRISPDLERVAELVQEILGVDLPDGLTFEPTLHTSHIREDNVYGGVRVKLIARLEAAKIPLQLDIGFGDSLIPEAQSLEYPMLLELPDMTAPRVLVYAIETVVAEKFQAMTVLGEANTRFKDFYDLYCIAQTESLEAERLRGAILATFERRETLPEEAIALLARDLASLLPFQAGWKKLIAVNPTLGAPSDFAQMMRVLRFWLLPILYNQARGHWNPSRQIWESS
jgi:hypothetical protein